MMAKKKQIVSLLQNQNWNRGKKNAKGYGCAQLAQEYKVAKSTVTRVKQNKARILKAA